MSRISSVTSGVKGRRETTLACRRRGVLAGAVQCGKRSVMSLTARHWHISNSSAAGA